MDTARLFFYSKNDIRDLKEEKKLKPVGYESYKN